MLGDELAASGISILIFDISMAPMFIASELEFRGMGMHVHIGEVLRVQKDGVVGTPR